VNAELLRLISALRAVGEIEEMMRSGEVNIDRLCKLLARFGLTKEQIEKIKEAARVYEETRDEERVYEIIAEAFHVPLDEMKKVMAAAEVLSLLA